MRKKNIKNYDLEFKQSAAKLAIESEQSVAETARSLGINENTLHGWIRKHGNPPQKPIASSELEKLHQELAQLRKENSRLKQERDILKKAVCFLLA